LAPSLTGSLLTVLLPLFATQTLAVRGLAVDQRSDIFAVGPVVYEILSGVRAFYGDTAADTISAILSRDPAPLSEANPAVPPAFERVVRRCLEKNPDERFHSVRDVAFALEAISDLPGLQASGQTTLPEKTRPSHATIYTLACSQSWPYALGPESCTTVRR